MTRFPALLFVLLLVVAAGCSSPASSAEESEPAATEEPTPEPSEAPEASGQAGRSLEPGAGELTEELPTEVGGITIEYESASGEDVLGEEGLTPEVEAFLGRVGASPDDLATAFGFGFDPDAGSSIVIVAIQVAGSDEETLRNEFLATIEEEGEPIGEETTLGGKTVQAFGEEAAQGYLYVNDDVVYTVGGAPAELVEEALAALP